MNPKSARSWWAITGVVAAVAAVAAVASQREFPAAAGGWNSEGPGYYSAEMVDTAPEDLPTPEELQRAWEETDKLHKELMEQMPDPLVEDQPGSGAKNGGIGTYEARVELSTLLVQSAKTGIAATETSVGGLLNAYVDDEITVQTGIEDGPVDVEIRALDRAPASVEPGWEDVSEMSFRAGADARVSIRGIEPYAENDRTDWVQRLDAHGQGWYRIRVHAKDRDLATGEWVDRPLEKYLVMAWPAPRADPIVHRAESELSRFLGE